MWPWILMIGAGFFLGFVLEEKPLGDDNGYLVAACWIGILIGGFFAEREFRQRHRPES